MLICKCGKVPDWSSIAPLCSLWPKPSVSNVIVKDEDLSEVTYLKLLWPKPSVSNVIVKDEDLSEVTLCNMLNFIIFLHGLKLVFRTSQYATMWLPLHPRVQY